MNNYLQSGHTMHVAADKDYSSSQCVVVGSVIGIANTAAQKNEHLDIALTGVYRVPKGNWIAWTQGQRLMWRKNLEGFIPEGATPQPGDITDCGIFAWGTRLNREQLAQRLGIHRHTLRVRLAQDRSMPRPGPDGRWLLSEIMHWEQRQVSLGRH